MLRELAARQAYQRFDAPQSSLTSQSFDEVAESDSFAAKPLDSLTSDFIYVSDDFKVQTGAKLTENLFVGKPLGCGLQGGVFLLQDAEGRTDPNHVLKVVFKFGIGGLFGMTNLEREWRVGRQLALLTEPGAALPGFMGTGAAMVLERIIGRDVARPVSDVDFNNVHYLRQMLYCVFKALHKAQRKLAFHHADLRLPNIMELFPSANNDNQPTVSTPRSGTIQSASLYDSQHVSGVLDHLAASALNDIRTRPSTHAPADVSTAASVAAFQQQSSRILARPSPYMRDLAGLETSELRAAHFKIIDFGLADFRETFGAGYIDGRVWPKEDELEVRLMMDLIHHVTGVRVTAWFAPPDKQPENGNLTFRDRIRFSMYGFWYRNEGLLHGLRIQSLRVRSFLSPANPGITAAEALTAPFFTFDQGDEVLLEV
ncbi:MAG: hypothetical protein FRX49_13443 [Trebouxia sp. A1-2]|nr:MAG: hypothetical protein FRX49_13443 [Trebouxia sp. A1-2]